jgi:hypothetical protein
MPQNAATIDAAAIDHALLGLLDVGPVAQELEAALAMLGPDLEASDRARTAKRDRATDPTGGGHDQIRYMFVLDRLRARKHDYQ